MEWTVLRYKSSKPQRTVLMREFGLDLGQDWCKSIFFHMILYAPTQKGSSYDEDAESGSSADMWLCVPRFTQQQGWVLVPSWHMYTLNIHLLIIGTELFGSALQFLETTSRKQNPNHMYQPSDFIMNFWVWYFNTEFICSYLWDVNRVSGRSARKGKNPSNTRLLYVHFEVKLHFMVKSQHSRSAAHFTITPKHGAALMFPT